MNNTKYRNMVAAMLVTFLLFTGCGVNAVDTHSATYFLMDTVVTVEIDAANAEDIDQQIYTTLKEFEAQYSMYIESSDIARINEAAGIEYVPVKESTYQMLQEAVALCRQSDGAFDITIGPLVDLWDVNGEDPSVPEITEELLELVNYEDILFNEEDTSVMLAKQGQKIDLGGLAKGAACDDIKSVYERMGPERALVSLGGNIVGAGQETFRIGIQDPRNNGATYMGIVEMRNDQIIATSGDYQRYFEIDGKRYHHIIDPKTGYPVDSEWMSLTVLHENGLMGDYLSTVLFMKSVEELEQLSGTYSFIAIDHDKNVYLSDDLAGRFTIEDETYKIK